MIEVVEVVEVVKGGGEKNVPARYRVREHLDHLDDFDHLDYLCLPRLTTAV